MRFLNLFGKYQTVTDLRVDLSEISCSTKFFYMKELFSNGGNMKIEAVSVEKPEEANVIIGQTHFIKSVEDLYEVLAGSVPNIRFGLAFCEASQDRLVRVDGNDEELMKAAQANAMKIAAGHIFVILIKNAFPINVLNGIKAVPEVCSIFCATANPVEVLVAETELGRGVIGVIDGQTPVGVESEEHVQKRKRFLREIGYKR